MEESCVHQTPFFSQQVFTELLLSAGAVLGTGEEAEKSEAPQDARHPQGEAAHTDVQGSETASWQLGRSNSGSLPAPHLHGDDRFTDSPSKVEWDAGSRGQGTLWGGDFGSA